MREPFWWPMNEPPLPAEPGGYLGVDDIYNWIPKELDPDDPWWTDYK